VIAGVWSIFMARGLLLLREKFLHLQRRKKRTEAVNRVPIPIP
jgi:hypothetical protein